MKKWWSKVMEIAKGYFYLLVSLVVGLLAFLLERSIYGAIKEMKSQQESDAKETREQIAELREDVAELKGRFDERRAG